MPTDCKSPSVAFTPLHRWQVLAQFDGGSIASDAGVLLLREVAACSRLFERMAGCLPDPRDPAMIEHDQQTMLAQRVLGIARGWEAASHPMTASPASATADTRYFRNDNALDHGSMYAYELVLLQDGLK